MLVAAQYGGQFPMLAAFDLHAAAVVPARAMQPRCGARGGCRSRALGARAGSRFALAHAVLLRDLPHGDAIVIDVLVGTFIGDTGAYLGGRAFGRRPLAPLISPNKTVEGLLDRDDRGRSRASGSPALYQDWLSGPQALLLGIAVALAAPLGDLFESFVKRDARREGLGRALRRARRGAGPARRGAVQRRSSATTSGTRCSEGRRPLSEASCRALPWEPHAAPPAHPRLDRLDRHAGARDRRDVRRVRASACSAERSWETLVGQAQRFGVPRIALADADAGARAAEAWTGGDVLVGAQGLVEFVVSSGADLVLNALVGSAGLGPTVATLGEGIDLALSKTN